MQFNTFYNNYFIDECISKANHAINSKDFHEELCDYQAFYLSDDQNDGIVTGQEISQMIINANYLIHVHIYRTWKFWSNVNAYFNPSKKQFGFFLEKKRALKRSSNSVAKTIIHEGIHVIDFHEKDSYFGHGNNSPVGKEDTAPWKVAEIASNYF